MGDYLVFPKNENHGFILFDQFYDFLKPSLWILITTLITTGGPFLFLIIASNINSNYCWVTLLKFSNIK
jgi:hypothetical protein